MAHVRRGPLTGTEQHVKRVSRMQTAGQGISVRRQVYVLRAAILQSRVVHVLQRLRIGVQPQINAYVIWILIAVELVLNAHRGHVEHAQELQQRHRHVHHVHQQLRYGMVPRVFVMQTRRVLRGRDVFRGRVQRVHQGARVRRVQMPLCQIGVVLHVYAQALRVLLDRHAFRGRVQRVRRVRQRHAKHVHRRRLTGTERVFVLETLAVPEVIV